MAGIGVKEVKTVTVTASDGQRIQAGDTIVICVKGQDVVCRFVELDGNSYFVTAPLVAGKERVKYRVSSIAKCYKVTNFVWVDNSKDPETAQEAGQSAAQPVLQPGV